MSRLDELIRKLCPDGVKFECIGNLAECLAGATPQTAKPEYWTNGTIPWMSSGEVNKKVVYDTDTKITQQGYDSCSTKMVPANTVVVALAGQGKTRGTVAITRIELCTNQSLCSIITGKRLLPDFLYHYLSGQYLKLRDISSGDGTRGGLNLKMIREFAVPVPPIEVQREIVRILDNFTELSAELTAELTAELLARQKQYSYYRDKLLSFDNGFVWTELGDVILSLNTGLNPRQFFKLNTDDAHNYYITIREIRNGRIIPSDKTDRINDDALRLCNNRSNLEIGDVLFSGTGTIGETADIIDEPNNWNIKEGVYVIKPNQKRILPRFLRYLLTTESIKQAYMKKVAGGTVKSIPMGELKKIRIPVPDIATQKRITILLDRFDALCNDLSSGLPAEIEARQKQYEYYRDKLLSFPIRSN